MKIRVCAVGCVLAAMLAGGSARVEAALTVTLEPSPAAPQTAGVPVLLQASASGATGSVAYQFAIAAFGDEFQIVRDYYYLNSFSWVTLGEGTYDVRVRAWVPDTGEFAEDVIQYSIASAASTTPVIYPSTHPLVMVYSAPACNFGTVRVRYRREGAVFWSATPPQFCIPGRPLNFYLAGLAGQTSYRVQHEVSSIFGTSRGPLLTTTSGAIDAVVKPTQVVNPADLTSSLQEPYLLSTYVGVGDSFPIAYDLAGNVVWYYALPQTTLTRPVAGGTMLTLIRDGWNGRVVREIDLAGNTVRETSVDVVNLQLATRGEDPIGAFHHEALRLPNGHTATIASVERMLTDVQGPGPVNVYGEMIVVLDENFQVSWVWNSFDHLDAARQALLGETCTYEGPGCPALFLAPSANDWLHANSIGYHQDGNLLLSIRHQDWVIKVDYRQGAGDGSVLWRLGQGGDFRIWSADPSPWFSHQHDASIRDGVLVLYDNGNARVEARGGNSRGQLMYLDETTRTAIMLRNIDLGAYASALGSAQRLANGNYHFDNGFLGGRAEQIEVAPDGTPSFVFGSDALVYRSFRLRDLFSGLP